jgi:tetratricopeptide (TPR) repeat protein
MAATTADAAAEPSNLPPTPAFTGPLKVFISYAHEDDEHREALVAHLAPLVDDGLIQLWHDRELSGGQDWARQIDDRLAEADIVLLLVSSAFMASDYCKGVEVKQALAMNQSGQARVVPVVLRSCRWTRSPIGKLQALPRDGVPITEAEHPDRLYSAVAEGIERVAESLRQGRAGAASRAPGDAPTRPGGQPKPFWRRPLPLWLAGGLLVGALSILLVGWLAQVKAGARDDLRIDRPDQAQERLGRVPEPLREAWPGLALVSQVVTLSLQGAAPGADSTRLDRQLRELLKRHPADPDLLYLQARTAYARSDLEALQKAAQQALQADPRHAATHSLLGLAADVVGDGQRALAEYRQAAELAPEVPQFAGNQARALLDLGQASEALAIYRHWPDFALAAAESALAYWSLGQLPSADRSLVLALDLLTRKEIADAVANRYDWTFIYPVASGEVNATSLAGEDRACYVGYHLAITRHLMDSASPEPAQPSACAGRLHLSEILDVIDADLCRYLVQRQPNWAEAVDRLRQGGLKRKGPCVAAAGPGA